MSYNGASSGFIKERRSSNVFGSDEDGQVNCPKDQQVSDVEARENSRSDQHGGAPEGVAIEAAQTVTEAGTAEHIGQTSRFLNLPRELRDKVRDRRSPETFSHDWR